MCLIIQCSPRRFDLFDSPVRPLRIRMRKIVFLIKDIGAKVNIESRISVCSHAIFVLARLTVARWSDR